ncbi:methylated-DNA--[protein]-cysteine S-methyltransferase [Arthrobacter sp. B0490]|uniref:methylated-DNA--[protein]-cysteine S-methyltransferase n=1 Tax=Arthrobacter sp. B0490 TaxID=2058891 RepID=UPI000CE57C7A|nr:methylated-DNA--[protein]-cysteine S-methyltransferase [Arthrobacter sp. B0490]
MSSTSRLPEDERWHVEIPSPVGALRIVAGTAAIVGLYHGDHTPVPPRASLGWPVRLPDSAQEAHAPTVPVEPAPPPDPTVALLRQAAAELGEYFAGLRREFEVPIELQGTAFQLAVWATLRRIPYGRRRSYRDIAGDLGNPAMGRAIGAAVRVNPVSIIVPGHRVVSSTGAVVGYAAGLETKTALLGFESGPVPVPAEGGA